MEVLNEVNWWAMVGFVWTVLVGYLLSMSLLSALMVKLKTRGVVMSVVLITWTIAVTAGLTWATMSDLTPIIIP